MKTLVPSVSVLTMLCAFTIQAADSTQAEETRNITKDLTITQTIISQNSVKEQGSGLELCNASDTSWQSNFNLDESTGVMLSTFTTGAAGEYTDVYANRDDERPNGQYLGAIKAKVTDDFGATSTFVGRFNSQQVGQELSGTVRFKNETGCEHVAKIVGKLKVPFENLEVQQEGKDIFGEVYVWLMSKARERFNGVDTSQSKVFSKTASIGPRG